MQKEIKGNNKSKMDLGHLDRIMEDWISKEWTKVKIRTMLKAPYFFYSA